MSDDADRELIQAMYVAAVNGQPPHAVDMAAALAVVRAWPENPTSDTPKTRRADILVSGDATPPPIPRAGTQPTCTRHAEIGCDDVRCAAEVSPSEPPGFDAGTSARSLLALLDYPSPSGRQLRNVRLALLAASSWGRLAGQRSAPGAPLLASCGKAYRWRFEGSNAAQPTRFCELAAHGTDTPCGPVLPTTKAEEP